MDRWKRLRCWLSVLPPCSLSSSPCDGGKSYFVSRQLHGLPRGVSGSPRPCLHGSCGGGSICSWGIAPPDFISRHHSANLRKNSILRSSSGSRDPGPPNLTLSASLLFALPPSPPEQRVRRDAGRGCGGGGGGGPIIAPVRTRGNFLSSPFCPSLSLLGPSAALSGRSLVNHSTVSRRRLTPLPKRRTFLRRYAPKRRK